MTLKDLTDVTSLPSTCHEPLFEIAAEAEVPPEGLFVPKQHGADSHPPHDEPGPRKVPEQDQGVEVLPPQMLATP